VQRPRLFKREATLEPRQSLALPVAQPSASCHAAVPSATASCKARNPNPTSSPPHQASPSHALTPTSLFFNLFNLHLSWTRSIPVLVPHIDALIYSARHPSNLLISPSTYRLLSPFLATSDRTLETCGYQARLFTTSRFDSLLSSAFSETLRLSSVRVDGFYIVKTFSSRSRTVDSLLPEIAHGGFSTLHVLLLLP
jgi:hypothetical protein